MNIAFFGTPPFTVDFLKTLSENGLTPSLIVTTPDRPHGRGMMMQSPAPKLWADTHSITVMQPEKLDDSFFATLSETPWDLFVVVAYGKIMPERIINLPRYGTINVHYSLLPRYRGATPVESAILHGDETTGISIQHMRYKLDTGPVFVRSEISVAPDDTTPTLRDKLNAEAVRLIAPTINGIVKGSLIPLEQYEADATHCSKMSKEDGFIALTDDPIELDRKYRAYMPWPGIYFYTTNNVRVKITKAHLQNGTFVIDEIIPENGKQQPFTSETLSSLS